MRQLAFADGEALRRIVAVDGGAGEHRRFDLLLAGQVGADTAYMRTGLDPGAFHDRRLGAGGGENDVAFSDGGCRICRGVDRGGTGMTARLEQRVRCRCHSGEPLGGLFGAVRVCEIHGLEGRDRRERGRGKIRAELAAADDRERFRVLARKVFCADGGRGAGAQRCDRPGVQKRLRLAGGKIKEERRAEKRRERLFRVRVIP